MTDEISKSDLPLALAVRLPGLQANHVPLKLQLGSILDSYYSFGRRNLLDQNVEESRLAGTCAARDKEVGPDIDGFSEQCGALE